MWLLDWLLARYNNVLDWFGGNYWTFRGYLSSLPSWIQSLVNSIAAAYNNAVNTAQIKINDFYNSIIGPLVAWLQGLINTAIARAQQAYDWVSRVDQSLSTWFTNAKNEAISYIKSLYDAIIIPLKAQWDNFYNNTLTTLLNRVNGFLPIQTWIQTLQGLLNFDWLKDILASWSSVKSGALLIANNPLGFVLGMFWSVGIQFLSFLIAYALGTTKYDLPSIPNWGGGAGGGPIELPPNAGPLGRPLASLYVSGYTYGPGHYGIDYGLQMGEAVYASHDGVVEYAGSSNVGYGLYIDLGGSPYWSRYAHLQRFNVAAGQQVKKGQLIGYGDSTGNSTGPHLHFELKVSGSYVNPVFYIS